MINNQIRKHIIFTTTHEDIINKMIDTIPGVNSFSEAVRYAVLSMADMTNQQQQINEMKRKLNVVSKNTDILVEMVAGGFHKLDVKAIGHHEESYVYQDALKHTEHDIQIATTKKAGKQPYRQSTSSIFR